MWVREETVEPAHRWLVRGLIRHPRQFVANPKSDTAEHCPERKFHECLAGWCVSAQPEGRQSPRQLLKQRARSTHTTADSPARRLHVVPQLQQGVGNL